MTKQTTFCYCPSCNNELCSSGSMISDIDGLAIYKCSRCGQLSRWDFNHPIPLLLADEPDEKFGALKEASQ